MSKLYTRHGVYYVRFRKGGELKWRSLGTRSKREAQRLRREIDALHADSPQRRTVAPTAGLESLRAAFDGWCDVHIAESTAAFYGMNLNTFTRICEARTIDAWTQDRIEAAKRELLRGRKPKTVNNIIGSVRTFVSRCIRQGWYAGPNPFARVEPLRVPERRPRWLSREEITRLLDAARATGDNAYLFVCLGIFAGLRKGEIDAAQWEWFDWSAGLLHVRQSAGFVTKSRKERTIPLNSELVRLLESYRARTGYVIEPENPANGQRYRHDIRKAFAAATKLAGLEWATPHTLRHTFASQLVSAGVSLYKVSQWLGHASMTTTQIYAHLSPVDRDIDRLSLAETPQSSAGRAES